jgi:hypothetical protein
MKAIHAINPLTYLLSFRESEFWHRRRIFISICSNGNLPHEPFIIGVGNQKILLLCFLFVTHTLLAGTTSMALRALTVAYRTPKLEKYAERMLCCER